MSLTSFWKTVGRRGNLKGRGPLHICNALFRGNYVCFQLTFLNSRATSFQNKLQRLHTSWWRWRSAPSPRRSGPGGGSWIPKTWRRGKTLPQRFTGKHCSERPPAKWYSFWFGRFGVAFPRKRNKVIETRVSNRKPLENGKIKNGTEAVQTEQECKWSRFGRRVAPHRSRVLSCFRVTPFQCQKFNFSEVKFPSWSKHVVINCSLDVIMQKQRSIFIPCYMYPTCQIPHIAQNLLPAYRNRDPFWPTVALAHARAFRKANWRFADAIGGKTRCCVAVWGGEKQEL